MKSCIKPLRDVGLKKDLYVLPSKLPFVDLGQRLVIHTESGHSFFLAYMVTFLMFYDQNQGL